MNLTRRRKWMMIVDGVAAVVDSQARTEFGAQAGRT
jgi:hypothetical protein